MPQAVFVDDEQLMLCFFVQSAFPYEKGEVILPVGNEGIQDADNLVLAGLLVAGA